MATNVCSSSFLDPGPIAFANRGAIPAVATTLAASAEPAAGARLTPRPAAGDAARRLRMTG
jgi:hypothetical protein